MIHFAAYSRGAVIEIDVHRLTQGMSASIKNSISIRFVGAVEESVVESNVGQIFYFDCAEYGRVANKLVGRFTINSLKRIRSTLKMVISRKRAEIKKPNHLKKKR